MGYGRRYSPARSNPVSNRLALRESDIAGGHLTGTTEGSIPDGIYFVSYCVLKGLRISHNPDKLSSDLAAIFPQIIVSEAVKT
jgi:hypothetical protein